MYVRMSKAKGLLKSGYRSSKELTGKIPRILSERLILQIFWGKDQTELFLILVATNTG